MAKKPKKEEKSKVDASSWASKLQSTFSKFPRAVAEEAVDAPEVSAPALESGE